MLLLTPFSHLYLLAFTLTPHTSPFPPPSHLLSHLHPPSHHNNTPSLFSHPHFLLLFPLLPPHTPSQVVRGAQVSDDHTVASSDLRTIYIVGAAVAAVVLAVVLILLLILIIKCILWRRKHRRTFKLEVYVPYRFYVELVHPFLTHATTSH